MFETANNNTNSRVEERFVVCYDRFTKPMAISLRNSLSKDSTCAIWSKKDYEQNEARLTNRNNLILLDESMVKSNLANPNLIPHKFSTGVLIKHENNTLGLYIDPNADLVKIKDTFSESWKKYVAGIVIPILTIGGIPLAIVDFVLMLSNDRKKVKFRLLFDAVNILKSDTIEKFLKGERLV